MCMHAHARPMITVHMEKIVRIMESNRAAGKGDLRRSIRVVVEHDRAWDIHGVTVFHHILCAHDGPGPRPPSRPIEVR